MTESGDGDGTQVTALVEYLRNPARGRRRLPAIVGLLEADDERTRLAAAWTCCLVAAEHPDAVEYLVRRLVDRLEAGEASLELTHALDYLADRHPEVVEDALAAMTETGDRAGSGPRSLPETGRFTRELFDSREPTRDGVGRVAYPGSTGADDPRRTYTTGEPGEQERAERRSGPSSDPQGDESERAADADRTGAGDETGHAGRDGATGDASPRSEGDLVGQPAAVSTIAARSRFDDLHVLASRSRGRYADDYRALVGQGSEERAVALRLLHQPSDAAARRAFEDGVRDQLDRWGAVDDHAHVVSLLDWGLEPRPWIATAFPGERLGDQDLDPRRALSDAIALTDAVSHLHRTDVVHGGIDPESVAYPGDVLDANDQDPPLLDNVSLLAVYRYHVDPATVLDPRFAAPEYFDRQFGRVDAATDIYQLGAVVFSLFAGRPPYGGAIDQVRQAVVDDDVPVPGDVQSGVPAELDEAVAKAMAPRKLRRYETVEHFQQDLVAVREADVL